MPSLPNHFGPSGLLALVFRRFVDIPVFLTVNIAIDLEVVVIALIRFPGYPPRYAHTLLVGSAIGIVWALLMAPLRPAFRPLMRALRLPCAGGLGRMVVSGVLGAWVHVLIDGLYRSGAGLFWPLPWKNPLCRFSRGDVDLLGWLSAGAAALFYAVHWNRSRTTPPG